MKVRSDFVTNSSSSSYTVNVIIVDKKDKRYSFQYNEDSWNEEGDYNEYFEKSLEELQNKSDDGKTSILGSKSLEELCYLLTNNIKCYDISYKDDFVKSLKENKEAFKNTVVKKVHSLDNVKKVILSRDYYANGEYAELIADNDDELINLAKEVVNSDGKAKKEALKKMKEYIENVNLAEKNYDFSFGDGFGTIKYEWNGTYKDLESLANRLVSNRGPYNVEGDEYEELDVLTGKIEGEATFYLS